MSAIFKKKEKAFFNSRYIVAVLYRPLQSVMSPYATRNCFILFVCFFLVLGTRVKKKVHDQDEIDMHNANPNVREPNATRFYNLRWALRCVCEGPSWVREIFT